MKEYHLNYYSNFRCIASECKHTCCAGWEMCIDSDTLLKYKNDASHFCATLKSGINFKKSKFKSDKLKRCAFLNEKGLCDIIINLGENSLCQVCRDHPRFRSFLGDRVETGLGFCCEQATKIILSFQDEIKPILTLDDKKDDKPSFIQEKILEFRQKAIETIQDKSQDINERIKRLVSLTTADVSDINFNKVIKEFFCFERLDKSWTSRLKGLKNKPISLEVNQKLTLYCEQFLVNSLFRHSLNAEDATWVRAITLACVICWWIINAVFENEYKQGDEFSLICDIVRAFSSEVEYSQKNLDKLFALSYKFIKI